MSITEIYFMLLESAFKNIGLGWTALRKSNSTPKGRSQAIVRPPAERVSAVYLHIAHIESWDRIGLLQVARLR